MAITEKMRNKLLNKLNELFQLDQPDLDFGFYRIMHAREKQVKQFINNDLLKIIEDAFGQADEARKAELQIEYENAIKQAKEYGAPNPEEAPKVKEAKAVFDTLKDSATSEADVYNHLYRFFERYYDDGDFISRRYYTRENSGKSAPYAIPYNGEEVKLHWANADQYYIKTTEYFSNYTFDLTQTSEFRNMTEADKTANMIPDHPLKVHFRIVDAAEGEHGNIKSVDDKKRFFVLHDNNPLEIKESGELIVNFEYKHLPAGNNKLDKETADQLKELYGKSIPVKDQPNLYIAHKVITELENLECDNDYKQLLEFAAPTDKIPGRPLLAKYINQYTARNTSDYFIHKDLGTFLKRELDFYIKNEVMHLDDIENADVPAVESYLSKIKVIRKIATKLINFLAQLEDFQKKLWLKKKFVVETNYCITLDRIPESLYPEIAVNDAQREEWVSLFAIDEIEGNDGDLIEAGSPAYSKPLRVEFLKANDKLVLDTRFFGDNFKAKLIESIDDFDEQCDGLLIHSENFQALNLLQERYREQVKCVYIDPPYNAQSTEILYKNTYKHSSWLSLIQDRAIAAFPMLSKIFVNITAIDEVENFRLGLMCEKLYPNCENACISILHNPAGQQGNNFSYTHEFGHFIFPQNTSCIGLENRNQQNRESLPDIRPLRNVSSGINHLRESAANCFYPIYVRDGDIIGFGDVCKDDYHPENINLYRDDGIIEVYPIDPKRKESKWVFARNTVESIRDELSAEYNSKKRIWDIIRTKSQFRFKTMWSDKRYNANSWGSVLLNGILPNNPFKYPKSLYTVQDCINAGLNSINQGIIIDYFAGSGTTAHVIINLNREDNGYRKYILVEMGGYFDTVLKPRITKVIYSEKWKNGKPTTRNTGVSHCFKYLRLESYEDTLNNLEFPDNPDRQKFINNSATLREDYILHYMLNVESRGSNSLLNIDLFSDPMNYTLKAKKPGSDKQVITKVDLIESFNYFIGLRVQHMTAAQKFTAEFIRKPDPELPEDQHTKLVVNGKINQTPKGKWWFKKIEGWVPADPLHPNNGRKENVLIVWRNLTGDLEQDNLMLDEWFQKYHISTRDFEYDTIYVNGSNNLPNLKKDEENWKVHLIEEEFHKRMWETGGAV